MKIYSFQVKKRIFFNEHVVVLLIINRSDNIMEAATAECVEANAEVDRSVFNMRL